MARPKAIGFLFFSCDSHLSREAETFAQLHDKGLQWLFRLWQAIYGGSQGSTGYSIALDKPAALVLIAGARVNMQEHEAMLSTAFDLGILDRAIWEAHGHLTGVAIQEQYLAMCRATKRKSAIVPELSLVPVSSDYLGKNHDEEGVSSELTPLIPDSSGIFQKKPPKGKERKVKEIHTPQVCEDELPPIKPPDPVNMDGQLFALAAEVWPRKEGLVGSAAVTNPTTAKIRLHGKTFGWEKLRKAIQDTADYHRKVNTPEGKSPMIITWLNEERYRPEIMAGLRREIEHAVKSGSSLALPSEWPDRFDSDLWARLEQNQDGRSGYAAHLRHLGYKPVKQRRSGKVISWTLETSGPTGSEAVRDGRNKIVEFVIGDS
jgi:hypothetical protein